MLLPWEKLSSELAFDNKHYTLRRDTVRLPSGKIVDDYFVSVRADIAIILAVTADDEILLVRQYKHGIGKITLELPAGTFKTGSAIDAAILELREETGYRCSDVRPVGTLFDDATKNSNTVHIFLGSDARKVAEQDLDENEGESGVEVLKLPLEEVLARVRTGEIAAQSTVAAIYRALDGRVSMSPLRSC
jgi:8-oxo-dGTP pyrophosphatase MutT (NUDIX family)